jgi:hypothetical protein
LNRSEALAYWYDRTHAVFVAQEGEEVVGTLPKAFEHPRLGFVDTYVMYRRL